MVAQQAAMYKMLQLLGLLVTAGLLSPCMAETFYVTPTLLAPADCPQQPCDTLDQYAHNSSLLAGYNNITLIFLEGVHILSYPFILNTNLLTLQPALPNQGQRPEVIGRYDTDHNGGPLFKISKASNTFIEGLSFENVSLTLGNYEITPVNGSITIKNSIIFSSAQTRGGVDVFNQ